MQLLPSSPTIDSPNPGRRTTPGFPYPGIHELGLHGGGVNSFLVEKSGDLVSEILVLGLTLLSRAAHVQRHDDLVGVELPQVKLVHRC